MLLLVQMLWAQELRVTSFTSSTDVDASVHRINDLNGQACALVKVMVTDEVTNAKGASVITLSNGKTFQKKDANEYWVYLAKGARHLTVATQNHLPLKVNFQDYGITTLDGLTTYELKLCIQGENEKYGKITVNSDPKGAEVFIDDVKAGLTPYILEYAIPGTHKVSVRKIGFHYFESNIEVQVGENTIINEKMVKSCDITYRNEGIDIKIKGCEFSLIKVEGSSFMIGATSEQQNSNDDEKPSYQVTLSDYYIGETEVTNDLWETMMGTNPSRFNTNAYTTKRELDMPITDVSWHDCQKFIGRLNSLTGLSFSLPTEAQWEFAARGGKLSNNYIYSGSNSPKEIGWFVKNSGNNVKSVKNKRPNELGIYDMSGNVWEWCEDWYAPYDSNKSNNPQGPASGKRKVIRGGCCANKDKFIRVSARNCDFPDFHADGIGMRLALVNK